MTVLTVTVVLAHGLVSPGLGPRLTGTSLALILATDDDVAGDEKDGAEPPQGREILGEDDEAEESGENEVGGRVHDGDLGGGVSPCEGLGEEGPHLRCVRGVVRG